MRSLPYSNPGIIGPAMDRHDSLTAARAPSARVRAWLLDVLPFAPGWMTARALEAARAEAGIGARALRTARERLLADGTIEKGRDGFQSPWRYRRAGYPTEREVMRRALRGDFAALRRR